MNLSDNLKKIRKDNNLSQEQLAEKLGVSRQSVSKWESGIAYPEMDKVLQICKMFNLNIDELLNQNIKEVRETKEVKSNINKYLDDFLNFISKTTDMFSCMKFRTKVKCIIEQIIVLCSLFIVFFILKAVFDGILYRIFRFLYYRRLYDIIFNIFDAFYIVFSITIGIIIFLQIFKVRYLDYYLVIKNKNIKSSIELEDSKGDANLIKNSSKEENIDELYRKKESEKIIIRDPNFSGYRFIKGLLNCILIILKAFELFAAFGLIILLVFQVIALVLSFLIVQTGTLFGGCFILIISSIFINLILLYIIYNWVFSKKLNKFRTCLTLILSVISMGIGMGLIPIGFKDFNYIQDVNSDYYLEESKTLQMTDDIVIYDLYNVEFVESDSNDINVICKHSSFYNFELEYEQNVLYFGIYDNSNFMEEFRQNISDINNHKIVDYSKHAIYIYTSKENILKIKENTKKYFDDINYKDNYIQDIITQKENLEKEVYDKDDKINELEQQIEEKDKKLNELQEIINNYVKE